MLCSDTVDPQAVNMAQFGEGMDRILLDEVSCTGEESLLSECFDDDVYGVHDCTHDEDAGVACPPDVDSTVTPSSYSSSVGSGQCKLVCLGYSR